MAAKKSLLFFGLLAVLAAVILSAVIFGSSQLKWTDPQTATIIWQLRVPRIILGFLVGAGLACCGVVFQAMLRNSLAEPYTLGITSGAALGATSAILMKLGGVYVTIFSFFGSLITISLVYAIASKRRFSNTALILGGVTLGFLFSSIVLLIFALARHEGIHGAIIWLMGDLSYIRPGLIKTASIFIVCGIAILVILGREIDIICLGDEKARHLGLNVSSIRRILFLTASLITGACVASAGIIGFVGLIIPHIARFTFGINHRRLLIVSAIMGAAFLIFCDMLARTIIRPLELPVGVITGIFGGLFFLGLLLKSKRWEIF